MESIELQAGIAGAIVSLFIAILKRWVTLDKRWTAFVALVVSFLVASVFFILNGKTWSEYIAQIATIYTSSQVVYLVVMKWLGLGDKIEGVTSTTKITEDGDKVVTTTEKN